MTNGSKMNWKSHTGRAREVEVMTTLSSGSLAIVKVLKGLPGEPGTYRTIPAKRLTEQ